MMALDILEAIKKHGATGIMVVALIWMNNRLNTVEDRLYDCYDDIAKPKVSCAPYKHDNMPSSRRDMVAVLPHDPIGKVKKC